MLLAPCGPGMGVSGPLEVPTPPLWWFAASGPAPTLALSHTDGAFSLTTSEDTVTISIELPAVYAGDYTISTQAISSAPVFIVSALASGPSMVGGQITVVDPVWLQSADYPPAVPSYQWFSDGLPISGATGPVFVTTDAEAGTVVSRQTTVTVNGAQIVNTSNGIAIEALPLPYDRQGVNNNGTSFFSLQQTIGLTASVQRVLIFTSFRVEAKQSGTVVDLGGNAGVFAIGSTTYRSGAYVEDGSGAKVVPAGATFSNAIEIGDTVNQLVAVEAGGLAQVYTKINTGTWLQEYSAANTASELDLGDQARFGILAEDIGDGRGVVDMTLYRCAIWSDPAVLPNIATTAVQDAFCDSNGVILDPVITQTAYGDAASGALRFDFYGDATTANAGTHAGAAGGGTVTSSGGFTNA